MPKLKTILVVVAISVVLAIMVQRSNAEVLYEEHFDTDVIGAGEWMPTNSSVYVNLDSGWLCISSNGSSADGADKFISLDLPFVAETRFRLVSNGQHYTLPAIGFFYGPTNDDADFITYLPNVQPWEQFGWKFMDEWTNVHTASPQSENIWITMKTIIRADGGELFAKTDDETDFIPVVTKNWSIPNEIVRLSFVQPWDATCQMDYIRISAIPDLLYIPSIHSYESELIIPVRFSCQTPTAAYQVGLCWGPTDFELKSVSFAGTAVESWGFKGQIIDNENQNVLIYAAVGQDFDYILTGEDAVLAYLHFENPLNTYDTVCILEPFISTDSLALVLDTCTINGEGLLFADTFKIPEPGVFYPNVMFDTSWAYSYPDYAYTPGNVNADFNTAGEPVINLVDILYVINFVYGNPAGPAPIPPSSGDVNGDCVVNLLDILLLINCKYGNPPVCDFVCGCVESSPLNKIGSTMQKYSDAPYGGEVSTEYADGKTIIMLAAVDVIKGIEMEIRLPDISANVSCPIEGMQVYSRQENDMIKLALFDINGQHQIDKGEIILLEIDGEAEIVSAFAGGMNAEPLYLEIAGNNTDSPQLPDKFALHQNHPNPFNPVTQISFELPVEAHVTLDVYNIMGQKVSTIADRRFAPGYHTVEWDGSSFASGVYFYRIQADDAIETRKMMLLK